jgi:hypothetical protein
VLEQVKRRSLVVKRALYAAIDAGWIKTTGRGVKGEPKLYDIADIPGPGWERNMKPVPVSGTRQEPSDQEGPGNDSWAVKVGTRNMEPATEVIDETTEDLLRYANEVL